MTEVSGPACDAPNVILVTMDSLRADHCDPLGSTRGLTPTMEKLAADGVNFRNAISTGPQTFSSMPAVFTGRARPADPLDEYDADTHWEGRLASIKSHMHRSATLGQQLQLQGYTTAAVTPNPWTSKTAGFSRGFDRFVDLSREGTDGEWVSRLGKLPGVNTEDRAVKLLINMLTGSSFFAKWTDMYDEITRLRDELPEPYFLWVFLLDTHYPFLTDWRHRKEQSLLEMYYSTYRSEKIMRGRITGKDLPEKTRQAVLRGYRDTIRASDAFLDAIVTEGDDEPVIVIHSDHGESFGEHGNYGHHHRELYEENVHVPYIISNIDKSTEVIKPVSLASIYSVIQELASTGTVTPENYTGEYVVTKSECGTKRALRGERYKYIETESERLLFDLRADEEEQENIAEEHPDLVKSLRRISEREAITEVELKELGTASKMVASSGQF